MSANTHSVSYVLGIICGVASVYLILLIVSLVAKAKYPDTRLFRFCRNRDYDERQLAVRGRAAGYAYVALALTVFAYGWATLMFDMTIIDPFMGIFICIIFSIAVYVLICIFQGAYFSRIENPKSFILLFSALAALNLLIGIRFLIHGPFLEDGVLSLNAINLIVGLLVLVVDIAVIVKSRMDSRAEEIDED
ncbi:MAG: hypothetical protein E7472_08645 [Ruminococcaceae bacterium]|nr:hypothetical protein [Oscillospiraceae bacterium]